VARVVGRPLSPHGPGWGLPLLWLGWPVVAPPPPPPALGRGLLSSAALVAAALRPLEAWAAGVCPPLASTFRWSAAAGCRPVGSSALRRASASGFGEGMGWRRKPRPACGLMTATPSGAVYLLEGVISLPLFPPLR